MYTLEEKLTIMKKYLMIGALGVFALSSCKKDYVCYCTRTTYDTNLVQNGWGYSSEIVSAKSKSKASIQCRYKYVNSTYLVYECTYQGLK